MQEVRVRAVPVDPYRYELLLELHDADRPLDGGHAGQPELVGNVSVNVKNGEIALEVSRIDEGWTGPVEVTVR